MIPVVFVFLYLQMYQAPLLCYVAMLCSYVCDTIQTSEETEWIVTPEMQGHSTKLYH